MTKAQRLWARAGRLLADPRFFASERDRVLAAYPTLSSEGLGQVRRRRRIHTGDPHASVRWCWETMPANLEAARDELRPGGECENGIRYTLEYFVQARISLSYRLQGCTWARRFNGPAPRRRSSYGLKHDVESHFRTLDPPPGDDEVSPSHDRYVSNGAFVCAALMAGLRIWSYQDSFNPDLRVGAPWAVAGLQPEDYGAPADEKMARFWRWVVQYDIDDPAMEDFVADTVELLYAGADLESLARALRRADEPARSTYERLWSEFDSTTAAST